MILDEEAFVDLYEVLKLRPDADTGTLRKRISELYLEARDNLEHQNHRKRFYYRELYEIHLPRARLIFLDNKKRLEYDAQLGDYLQKSGKPPLTHKPPLVHKAPSLHKPRDTSNTRRDDLPDAAPAEEVDPFADFADIDDDIPLPPVASNLRMNPQDVERRRNLKRRELIKHELIAEGLKWGVISASVTAISLLTIVVGVLTAMHWNSPVAYILSTLSVGAISALVSRQSTREAKKSAVASLSQMPYDELLRYCAGK